MKAILVSVDYGDILSITLPYNRHHFKEVMIVTTDRDKETQAVAKQNKAELFITNAFYWDEAVFNKWRALELGLDKLGRDGWLCIMDADVLWPKKVCKRFKKGKLHSPCRRVHEKLGPVPLEDEWENYPRYLDQAFCGYTLIFHADDPILPDPPWHEINWAHAGGADTFFQNMWKKQDKVRLDWDVLHLGPPAKNWCGRSTIRVDGRTHPSARSRHELLREFMRYRHIEKISGGDKYAHERIRIREEE